MFSNLKLKLAIFALFVMFFFSSIDADASRITGVHLVDVGSNTELGYLHNGAVIDLAVVPQINLSAIPNGNITKVLFYVNGNFVRSEGVAPYAIGGDAGGVFNNWTHPGVGTHIFDIVPVNGLDTGVIHSVSVQIINSGSNNLYSLIEFSEPSCSNSNNGSASANGIGGTPPYAYAWSTGASTQQISNLNKGTYTVIVTDNSGSTFQSTCSIVNPLPLSGNATITNESLSGMDGGIELDIIGGTCAYNISWSNGAVTSDISNLSAGNYTINVTDYYGCTFTSAYSVILDSSITPILINESITSESCFGNDGAISISYSGGQVPYNVLWSNGSTTDSIINISQGTYTVTITDANFFSETQSYTVPFDASSANFSITTVIVNDGCYSIGNGSINLSVSGGTQPYLYNWSNGSSANPNLNLSSGSYTVMVTDQNGCSGSETYTVGFETSDPSLSLNATVQNITCNNSEGSIVLNPTGGLSPYFYSWTAGNVTAECDDYLETDSTVIIEAESGTLISHWSTQTTLPAYTGSSYIEWKSGDSTLQIQNPGKGVISYNVNISNPGRYHFFIRSSSPEVSEHNDCYVRFIDSDILLQLGATSFVSYNDTAIKLFQNTGSQDWTWQTKGAIGSIGGQIWTDFDSAGSYEFQIHGRSNLFKIDRIMLVHKDYSDSLAMDTSNIPSPQNDCNSNQLLNLNAGQYGLILTDANGCETNSTFDVSEYQPITITSAINNPDCNLLNSGSVRVEVQGGSAPYSYNWSSSASDTLSMLENIIAGNYTITVSDNDNCTQTAIAELANSTSITVSDSIVSATCKGINDGEIYIDINAAYIYLWSNGSANTSLSNLSPGEYYLQVSQDNCSELFTYSVPAIQSIILSETHTNETAPGALDGSAIVVATNGAEPYQFLWNTSPNQYTGSATTLAAGTYHCTVTDSIGCFETISVTIE